MKPGTLLPWVLLTVLFVATSAVAQGDDFYFVNGGKLWRWPSQGTARNRPAPYPISLPSSMRRIESIAINARGIAFVTGEVNNEGYRKGNIYQTDGVTATLIYQHDGRVRQLASGPSDDVLYFSSVELPSPSAPSTPDGKIYQLNLITRQATPYLTIRQSSVGGGWNGALTIDGSRTYIATGEGIYWVYPPTSMPLPNSGATLRYRSVELYISSITAENGPLFFSTPSDDVYRLTRFTDRAVAVSLPGAHISHITYVPFPAAGGQPCELLVRLSGYANLMRLYTPAIRGPNLHWVSPNLSGNGGPAGIANYRYFVPRGIYWVSMDTKADTTRAPTPRERKVDCNGVRGEATFSF